MNLSKTYVFLRNVQFPEYSKYREINMRRFTQYIVKYEFKQEILYEMHIFGNKRMEKSEMPM